MLRSLTDRGCSTLPLLQQYTSCSLELLWPQRSLSTKVTKYKSSVREDLRTETVKRTHWSCQEQGGTGLFHGSLCQMKFVDQSLLQGITPAVAAIARGMYLESILSCILQQSMRNLACHPLLCALLQASSGSPLRHVLHHR